MSLTDDFLKGLEKRNATGKVQKSGSTKPSSGSSKPSSGTTTKKKKKETSTGGIKKTNSGSGSNSFTSDFLDGLKKRGSLDLLRDEDDIAPVSSRYKAGRSNNTNTKTNTTKKDDGERTWFKSGSGNVAQTILGTIGDVGEDLLTGIVGMGEKAVDALATIAPYVSQAQFNQNGGYYNLEASKAFDEANKQAKKELGEFVAKDLYDEQKVAQQILFAPVKPYVDMDMQELFESMEQDSVLGEKSDALVQSAGQLAAQAGLSLAGVPWFVTSGATSFGAEAETAFKEGATHEEATASAAISAGAEILSEKLFGGDIFTKGTGSDLAAKYLSRAISNKALRTLAKLGIDATGEGFEEVFSEFAGNLGSALYKEENLGELLFNEEALDGYLESAVGGAVLGGGMGGINVIQNKKSGVDFVSGLTANEQKVVDQVYKDRVAEAEKDGKKPNKSKIYDEVLSDMEKGFISTDTIERILGGETYKTYKDTVDSEDAILKEFEELGNKQNATLAEQARYAELQNEVKRINETSQRNEFKTKLNDEVMSLVQGDRLLESYNERSRRGQAFEADLSKYDAKQQETIKRAVDSGILNNTNRTHQFVDIVAKISADKGVSFDFTNNEKLKESGFAVDGATVNGFITKDGISINIDSPKAWQSTVGHEVTHVLEGTELYGTLRKAVFEYARQKNDFQGRRNALAELYKDVQNADIDKELTADLVGDYLFTDTDFINRLSTENRNVFRKIYDEIKYLCKVATAGSKEARELEKVRKAFADAYKASGKAVTDTKYSMSADSTGKELSKGQQEYFKDSKMRDENGNLKVMYHGSQDAGFHVFDNSFSDDDTSFFFVDRNDVATSYSGTSETYAPVSFRTADDANKFFADNGLTEYEVVEENGKYTLLDDGDEVATSDSLDTIYEEFRDWSGLGYGDANYKVYLNLTNPLVVDAEGRNWNNISREFSQEVYDRYQSLTAEEREALTDVAEWGEYSVFRDEMLAAAKNPSDEAYSILASAYEKLGGANANLYDAFSIASDNFSEDALREFAVKQMKTRDYAKQAKEQGYDGVIFKNIVDNGGYSNGSEGASTVAIAFDSNQIKSVANTNPTGNPDIRYSLSKDSEGRELSKEQAKYFKGSKVVDSNGNLKAVYHGSPSDFNTFSLEYLGTNGTAEGYGFYFTDKKDIAENYSKGTEGQQNGKPGKLFEVYLDIKKPLSDTDVTMSRSQFRKFLIELNNQVDADGEPLEVLSNYGDVAWEGLNNVLNYAMEIEYDGSDSDVNMIHSVINGVGNMQTVFDVLRKTTGYDGIIVKEASWGGDQTIYIAFHPEQIKNIDNLNPTTDHDIRRSLSKQGETPKQYGSFSTPATELRLETAPVKEVGPVATVSKNTTVAMEEEAKPGQYNSLEEELTVLENRLSELEQQVQDAQGDLSDDALGEIAEEWTEKAQRVADIQEELQAYQSERLASLNDSDIPPEVEAPYPDTRPRRPDDPFYERDIKEVGNQKVKPFMSEHPEVKPYFEEAAYGMFEDIENGTRGERWYSDQLYYDTNGEKGWGGTKRNTTDDIADLLDNYGYTYKQIENALNAIIEGGKLNACAKRIEFALNDRLLNGYTDVTGRRIPANQDYINLIREMQDATLANESLNSFMENADAYAPPVEEDIAPVKPSPAPVAPNGRTEQLSMFPREKAKSGKPTSGRIAAVLDSKSDPGRAKNGPGFRDVFKKGVAALVDKGMVFENMSLETGNHELQAKWDYALPAKAEARAQFFMKHGDGNAKSLDAIMQEVGKKSERDFLQYLYHVHNIDRMTLDKRFGIPNKAVFGDVMSADDSRQIVKQYETDHPEFKAYAEDVYAFCKSLRNMLVDGGLISRKTADLWQRMYPHYVPVGRVDANGQNIKVPLDTNKTGVNAPVKRATGGNSDIRPLYNVLAERAIQTFKAVARNDFGIELKNTIDSMVASEVENATAENGPMPTGTLVRASDRSNFGVVESYNEATGKYAVHFKSKGGKTATVWLDAKLLTPIKTPDNVSGDAQSVDVDEIIDAVDIQEALLKPGGYGVNPSFTVFQNGKRVEFDVSEEMFDALKPTSKALAYRNKVVAGIGNARRNLLTQWNPVFALYRNPIKDVQDALINSQHPIKTYIHFPEAIISLATNGKWATEYQKNGGDSQTYYESSSGTFKADDSILKKTIGMPLNALESAGNFIEQIPRLAEYIASRKDGRSVQRSMLDAARVTTNFVAGGDVTKFANAHGFTFLNASVQGASQAVRNVREAKANGLKGWAKLAAKVALAGLPHFILNDLYWDDDEEYEELSDYVKDNYYIVAKFGDGKFVRIPKGRVLAVIQDGFKQMENLITGNDEVDLQNFLKLVIDNIAPNNPFENNILAPIIQTATGKTWYKEDMIPSRLQDVPATEQFDESTDSISLWLSENLEDIGIETSPIKINYLLDQYSGGVGDVFLPMLTPEAESGDDTFTGNLLAPWKKEATTDSVLNNQNVSDFYDLRDEIEATANGKDATEEDVMRNMYIDAVGWDMSDLYKQKREIQLSDMPDSVKYKKTRDLQKQIDELAKGALNGYNDVSIDGVYSEVGDRRFNYSEENGKWYEITPQNYDGSDNYYYQKEQEVTKGLGIGYAEYWNNRDEYNYAYDKPGRYALAQAVGGYDAYMGYYDVLENWKSDSYLAADKDSNGNSISGSRKEKVIDYINGLDADYGTKIILYRSVYESKADKRAYNQDIVDYLNSRDDISYEQMEYILKELGFEVDSKGNITW